MNGLNGSNCAKVVSAKANEGSVLVAYSSVPLVPPDLGVPFIVFKTNAARDGTVDPASLALLSILSSMSNLQFLAEPKTVAVR